MFNKLEFWAIILLLRPRSSPSTFFSHQLCCRLTSLTPPSPARGFGAFSTETYWLHWRSHAARTPQHLPILFVFKWACRCGSAAARINAQISTISLRLHVCQTTCCKGITRCLLDAACRWQLPHHLVFALRLAQCGTRWRLPTGRALRTDSGGFKRTKALQLSNCLVLRQVTPMFCQRKCRYRHHDI